VAGAIDSKDYIAMMEAARFTDINITPTLFDKETVDEAIKDVGDQIDLTNISQDKVYTIIYSARITARKR
jgi:hypothetical protein